jgi:putative flavoprotein involved in K+ transport
MGDSPEGDVPGGAYFRFMEHTTTEKPFGLSESHAASLLEEGAAFGALATLADADLEPAVRKRDAPQAAERFQVVVIGAGQCGLSAGYHLARRGLSFVVLNASPRVGDQWRGRWDSLRLFTPARYDSLVGMRFPAPATSFPTKDEMADYLEAYAKKFALPIRSSVSVDRITRGDRKYVVSAGRLRFEAEHVIVATSSYRAPHLPHFARDLRPSIRQLHSSEYVRPGDLQAGSVLVVGAGNSGAEIALELAKQGRDVILAGRDPGHVPFRIESFFARFLLVPFVLRVLFHRIFSVRTPMGRRMRAKQHGHAHPWIRTKPSDLVRAGVRRAARVSGVRDGLPVLEDGRTLEVANVVWCTGFDHGFEWIDLPIFGDDGEPRHDRGIVRGEPGLYFLGLPFLSAMSSIMVHGAARDAARVVRTLASRLTS